MIFKRLAGIPNVALLVRPIVLSLIYKSIYLELIQPSINTIVKY